MKVTLITGASLGIGQAFAKQLASEKHNLLLIARSENKLKVLCDELMAKYNIKAYYFPLDLTKPGADQTLFEGNRNPWTSSGFSGKQCRHWLGRRFFRT